MSRDTREVCPATSHGTPRHNPAPKQADRARYRHSQAYSRAQAENCGSRPEGRLPKYQRRYGFDQTATSSRSSSS
ncbi:MAG: hypothetical protein QOJ66_1619 [Ilumatobacteraceae bacterium]